jgi:transcriptional/translational regulatory protein YebC/TACO1
VTDRTLGDSCVVLATRRLAAARRVQEEATKLAFKPLATVHVESDEQFHENVEIFERCLQLEDVDAIYTNCADVGLLH